jgi:hypothetical protein
MSAIYLTQYAAPTRARWMKPILEMLAGVPTVVYGYFAALTVAPAVRDFAVSFGIPRLVRERARRGPGDGRDDHPVRLLDGRRFDRRGAHGDARRQPRDGRDDQRDDLEGADPRRAARRGGGVLLAVSARSARR